jgi:hypothetical protein
VTTRKLLTPDTATRALYIDFEGRKDRSPVLLGVVRRSRGGRVDRVWQACTDPAFAPIAGPDGLNVLDLPDAIEHILQRAEAKDRLIVAWSDHELDVVRTFSPTHVERFSARYVNARTFAVHWRNARHAGARPPTNELADYLALIDHRVPPEAGKGGVGDTLRVLGDAFARGRGWGDLTDHQRRRWHDLRDHNRHDCVGMRRVCLLAAREVEEGRAAWPASRSMRRSSETAVALR